MAYLGVGLGVGALAGAAFMALRRRTGLEPAVTMTPTESNKAILAECPSLTQPYKVAPWLTNPHVETIFAALLRRTPAVKYERELLRMEDGGTVAVDWLDGDVVQALPAEAPMLVLLPGLTGGSHDSYVAHMALAAAKEGIRPVVFNSRGTSDAPVTSPQFYSASYTGDMRRVLEYAMREYPAATVLAAGWSLGANILLCYLGEEGSRTPVRAAVSLCNPFDLVASDENFQKGFSRVYDKKLAKTLKGLLEKNQEVFISEGHRKGIDVAKAISSKSIRDFDEFLTTKSFDWDSVDDYYAGSCSADRIPDIKVPVLCVQADNDPIAPSHAIPFDRIKANENCILVTTPYGGHLGWTAGPSGVMGEPWTDTGVVEYLKVMASRRTTLERGMQTGGTEAEEAFAEQSSRMETVLQQQVEAMGARDAELAELRVQLSAAQAAACEAGQGRAAAAAHIEDITKRERQWYEAFQVAQAEIKSLRAWIDGSAGGAATGEAECLHRPCNTSQSEHLPKITKNAALCFGILLFGLWLSMVMGSWHIPETHIFAALHLSLCCLVFFYSLLHLTLNNNFVKMSVDTECVWRFRVVRESHPGRPAFGGLPRIWNGGGGAGRDSRRGATRDGCLC